MNDDQEVMALGQETTSFTETNWASYEIDSVLTITGQELSRQHFMAIDQVSEPKENKRAGCGTLPEFDPEKAKSGDDLPFILWMNRLANFIGYRHFQVVSFSAGTRSKTVSSWPNYLLKRLDEQGLVEQVFDELKATETGSRGQLLANMNSLNPEVGNRSDLSELFQATGMLNSVGFLVESEKRKENELLVIFGDPLDQNSAPGVADEVFPLLARIADWYFVVEDCVNNTRFKISKRERECIRWSAEGKTSYEMSLILDLSENTVNNYIATAGRKLGAVNRAHMISIALKSGIID